MLDQCSLDSTGHTSVGLSEAWAGKGRYQPWAARTGEAESKTQGKGPTIVSNKEGRRLSLPTDLPEQSLAPKGPATGLPACTGVLRGKPTSITPGNLGEMLLKQQTSFLAEERTGLRDGIPTMKRL